MTEVSPNFSGNKEQNPIHAVLGMPVRYWKQTLAAVVVVVAVAGGYSLVTMYQKNQAEKAMQNLSNLVATTKDADRLAALEAMAKTAPSSVRDAVSLELAKAAMAAGDYAKAAAAWGAVSKDAPEAMRAVAGLGQAAALCQAGKAGEAVTVLENLKAGAPKAFVTTVDRQLAITAEAAGQWQKAVQAYERLKEAGNVQNPGFIDARIADLKAKADAAAGAKTNG